MRISSFKLKQASALALLLLFVSGWLAVPVTIAHPEPITCGMTCCEEEGVCCCFLSRQAHQHEDDDSEQEARLLAFRKGCSSDCATLSISRNVVQDLKPLAPLWRWDGATRELLPVQQTSYPLGLVPYRRAAPRAPPFHV